MQTYTHRLGETPEPLTLWQSDGVPYDLSDTTVTLAVHDGGVCTIVPVTVPDPLLGTVMPDQAALDAFTPRVRRAVLHIIWADASHDSSPDFAINFVEAC